MPTRKVLVVEDDEAIRKSLIDCIGCRPHVEVDGARDGVDALHRVLTHRYDVIVLDMMMPKMSGGDFLDSLKAMISDPSLNFVGGSPEIIVVTAALSDDLPAASIQQRFPSAVRAVLRKPVDMEALMKVIGH